MGNQTFVLECELVLIPNYRPRVYEDNGQSIFICTHSFLLKNKIHLKGQCNWNFPIFWILKFA